MTEPQSAPLAPCEKYPHFGCGCDLDDGTMPKPEAATVACTCEWGTVNAGYVHGIGSSAEYVGPIRVRKTTDPACPKHAKASEEGRDERA